MQVDVEAVGEIAGRLRVRQCAVGEDPRGRAHALPVGDHTPGRAQRLEPVEVARGTAGRVRRRVVVAAHHHRGFLATRQIPEMRQRQLVTLHQGDQVHQQPLLLISLRNRDLARIEPIRLHITGLGAKEHVVGTHANNTIPLLPRPGRIPLPRIHNGTRQIERERRRLTTTRANRPQRHGRTRGRSRRIRIQSRDRRRPTQRIPVSSPVKLNRASHDPRPRRRTRIHLQVRIRKRRPRIRQPEQPRQLLVRPHRNQVPARAHPTTQRGHLPRTQRHIPQHHHIKLTQERRRDRRDIDRRERIETLVAQDLREIRGERVGRRRHDEDRRLRSIRRERPAHVRRERIPRRIGHTTRATLHLGRVHHAELQRTLTASTSPPSTTPS